MKVGKTFGIAKRIQLKKQQSRRGSFNSIMGYGFGRISRKDYSMKEYPVVITDKHFGATPERRNIDSFRFGSFGTAKRHTRDPIDASEEISKIEGITLESDSRNNYLKFLESSASNNMEN